MEETIGYEALFSPDEWAAMDFGDWSLLDEEEGSDSDFDFASDLPSFSDELAAAGPSESGSISSGAVATGPGSAALTHAAVPEGTNSPRHEVTITEVEDGYELTCTSCDFWDHLSDERDAAQLKRLHEEFVASLIECYEVER